MPAYGNNNYDDQLREYQRMAQSLNPQMPMMGQGMFSRVPTGGIDNALGHIPFIGQHLANGVNSVLGGADRVLDNGMLAAAMVPEARGPEGVGGGISRALQGVLGAGQYRRQMALQSAMLPYQMMGPQIEMQDKIAQMQQRASLAQHYQAQDKFYDARAKHYEAQEDLSQQRINNRAPTPTELNWQVAMGMHPPKNPDNITPSEYTTLAQDLEHLERKGQNRGNNAPGGFMGAAVMGAYGPPADPTKGYTNDDWDKMAQSFVALSNGQAAGRARGTAQAQQNVRQPIEDTEKFVGEQQANMFNDLGKRPSEPTMEMLSQMNPGQNAPENVQAYRKAQVDYDMARSKRADDFARYRNSGAANNGVLFSDFLKNPNAHGTPASSSSPTPSGSKPLPF